MDVEDLSKRTRSACRRLALNKYGQGSKRIETSAIQCEAKVRHLEKQCARKVGYNSPNWGHCIATNFKTKIGVPLDGVKATKRRKKPKKRK